MNKLWRPYLLWLVGIAFVAVSCKDRADKKTQETAVLKHVPFASLTDSILRAKPEEAAGLYFRRAELLSRNNLHELAAEDYKRSWTLHPDEATGLRYGSTLSILGQTDEA